MQNCFKRLHVYVPLSPLLCCFFRYVAKTISSQEDASHAMCSMQVSLNFLLLAIAPFVFASLSLLLQPTKFVKGFLQDKPVLKISFLQEKNLRGIYPNLRRQLMRLICCQFWLCLSLLELELCQLWLCLCTLNLELLSTFATSVVLTYTETGLLLTFVVPVYSKSGALPALVVPIFTGSGTFENFGWTCLG